MISAATFSSAEAPRSTINKKTNRDDILLQTKDSFITAAAVIGNRQLATAVDLNYLHILQIEQQNLIPLTHT